MGMYDASQRATGTVDEKGPSTKPQEADGKPPADPTWSEHHAHQAAHHKVRAAHHEAMASLHTKQAAHHNKEAAYHQERS